jgi:hypothetical protein
MRLALTLMLLAPIAGMAQPPAMIPCIAHRSDGTQSQPGHNFAAMSNGRLLLLVTRAREGQSEVTDFLPHPNRPGVSYFIENNDIRGMQRPSSIFILATVNAEGEILYERWLRDDQRAPEFSSTVLRCTP